MKATPLQGQSLRYSHSPPPPNTSLLLLLLAEISPSHPFHYSELFLGSALDIKQIVEILPKLLILYTSQNCFYLLEESLGFADKPARIFMGNHTIRKRRGRQQSSDVSGLISLSRLINPKESYRKPRRNSCRLFPFCKPRRLPKAPTSHRTEA